MLYEVKVLGVTIEVAGSKEGAEKAFKESHSDIRSKSIWQINTTTGCKREVGNRK